MTSVDYQTSLFSAEQRVITKALNLNFWILFLFYLFSTDSCFISDNSLTAGKLLGSNVMSMKLCGDSHTVLFVCFFFAKLSYWPKWHVFMKDCVDSAHDAMQKNVNDLLPVSCLSWGAFCNVYRVALKKEWASKVTTKSN